MGTKDESREMIVLSSKDDFEKFKGGQMLRLIHFSSTWAAACKQMDEILLEFLKEFPGTFELAKIDAEGVPEASIDCDVISVPTIIFFKDGKQIDKRDGFSPLDIKNLIVKHSTTVQPYTSASHQNSESTASPNQIKEEILNQRLKSLTNQSRLMLFMKGSPEVPKCGFSRQIVDLLRSQNAQFSTFDILEDEEVRQGLKKYSDWPTYPQLYLDGEFLGGLDVIREEMKDQRFVERLPKKMETSA